VRGNRHDVAEVDGALRDLVPGARGAKRWMDEQDAGRSAAE
jgi:hypothetical protein